MTRTLRHPATKQFNVLVGAVTVIDNRFLLIRRSDTEKFLPGIWGIPAGEANYGETPEDAVLRELREETGLRGKVAALVGYSMFESDRHRAHLYNIQLNFLVHGEKFEVELNPASHSAAEWVHIDDLDNKLLDNFTRATLEPALAYMGATQATEWAKPQF
jgi:8-oxo-dGTP diphosphatase